MAITPIQQVQRQAVQTQKTKKGGSRRGQIAGAIAGGIIGTLAAPGVGTAAGASAGALAAGALGGAAGGSGLGGMLGEVISPSKSAKYEMPNQVPQLGQISLSQSGQQLQRSLMALQQMPQPVQQEMGFPLVAALMRDVEMNNPHLTQRPQQGQGLSGISRQPGLGGIV